MLGAGAAGLVVARGAPRGGEKQPPSYAGLTEKQAYASMKSTNSTNSTAFGIRLEGCRVESCVPGTPAYITFHAGDEIVEVDGHSVDDATCGEALIGSDIPGSLVVIGYIDNRRAAGVQDEGGRGVTANRQVQRVQLRRLLKEHVMRLSE